VTRARDMGNFARDVDSLIELDGNPIVVEYVVVAAGGGVLSRYDANHVTDGGGGGGGYRSSISGESSGGGASAESALIVSPDSPITITVGAGTAGANGSNSVLGAVTSTGGGRGGWLSGAGGGSGGGGGQYGSTAYSGASGTANQGYGGGNAYRDGSLQMLAGGGGGGAGGAGTSTGQSGQDLTGGNGGPGVTTNVTGSARGLAGGGGGARQNIYKLQAATTASDGGQPGATIKFADPATYRVYGLAGTVNTGGGAGGGLSHNQFIAGVAGGSGIIFIRVADTITATFSAGVTYTTYTPTGYNVYEITAAGASDTVTFS
jgi:hypothetical protein